LVLGNKLRVVHLKNVRVENKMFSRGNKRKDVHVEKKNSREINYKHLVQHKQTPWCCKLTWSPKVVGSRAPRRTSSVLKARTVRIEVARGEEEEGS
jgi:hypothetical protein